MSPVFPPEIIDCILFYACSNDVSSVPCDDDLWGHKGPYPVHLLLVSKAFYERALPKLYRRVTVARPSDWMVFFCASSGRFVMGCERAALVQELAVDSAVAFPSRSTGGQGIQLYDLDFSGLVNVSHLCFVTPTFQLEPQWSLLNSILSQHVFQDSERWYDHRAIDQEIDAYTRRPVNTIYFDDENYHWDDEVAFHGIEPENLEQVALLRKKEKLSVIRTLIRLPGLKHVFACANDPSPLFDPQPPAYHRKADPPLIHFLLDGSRPLPHVMVHLYLASHFRSTDESVDLGPQLETKHLSALFDQYSSAKVFVHEVEIETELKERIQTGGDGVGWRWIDAKMEEESASSGEEEEEEDEQNDGGDAEEVEDGGSLPCGLEEEAEAL